MKKTIIAAAICIVALVLILSVYFISRPKQLLLQGVADAAEIRISSRVPGRVDNIFVHEGETVQAGQLLITIDAPDLRAKAAQADAAKKAANAQKQKTEKGARKEEIDAVYNLWQKAIVGERISRQTFERVKKLYEDGVVSAQQMDEAQAKYDAAKKDALAAKAQYKIATDGTRIEDKKAANALAQQAQGAVDEVESYLEDTTLSSPIDGEISSIILSQGELAGQGTPLITITNMNDIYFVFNIREDLMPNIEMGKIIEADIPAIDENKHQLKITYISPRGDFAAWSATKAAGQFDLRTFEVRAKPVNNIKNLRPGMSAIFYMQK